MPTATAVLRRLPPRAPDAPDAELLARHAAGDPAAFEGLVRRHAGLVWHVCRHVLRHHDAEDAFQATFLVLARRAADVRPGSVAAFLHGVALRVALRARRKAAHAAVAPVGYARPTADPAADAALGELQSALAEEVDRLPENFRAPFILCVLEGTPRADAARSLGWGEGTLSTRLAAARVRLRDRLGRRGVLFAAAVAAFDLGRSSATVPDRLVAAACGSPGAAALALAGAVVGRTVLSRLLVGACVLLGLAGAVLVAASTQPGGTPGRPSPPAASAPDGLDAHGDSLPSGATQRLGTTRFRHGQWVRSVAFSPDGTEVASASFDGTVRVWDRATGRELRRLKEALVEPHFVAYVAGGKHLLTAEGWYSGRGANPVRLWDARTGEAVRTLVGRGPRSNDGVAVSPDGKTLAFAGDNGVALLACAEGGRNVAVPAEGGKVRHLAFSPDGNRLIVCAGDARGNNAATEPFGVRLVDLVRPAETVWQVEGKSESASGRFPAAEFSPDGKRVLASFNYKEQPVLLDADTGKQVRRLEGPHVGTHPMHFLPGGKQAFTATWGGTGVVWDVATGKPAVTWPDKELDVLGGSALSPDGKVVATAGHRAVELWEAGSGKPLTPEGPLGDVNHLTVFPDGRRVLAGSYWDRGSGARVWDLATGRVVAALPARAASVALAPDGASYGVGYYHGTPAVVEPAFGKVLRAAKGDACFLDSLAFGLGGRVLVGTGWTDRSVRLWEADTLKPLPPVEVFPQGGGTRSVAVTPGGAAHVSVGLDGVVRVFDLTARKVAREFAVGERGDWKLAVSPDGRLAVTGLTRERYGFHAGGAVTTAEVSLWDLAAGTARLKFAGPEAGANSLTFSPDGRALAVGSQDGGVWVYELATGRVRAEFRGHVGPVTAVAFHPDGRRLLSGGADTTVLVWDLTRPPDGQAVPDPAKMWADLFDLDAFKADRAMRGLLATPDATLAHLKVHLKPEPAADTDRVRALIDGLGAPAFADREAAQRDLERLGASALPALRAAAAGPGPEEVRLRAGRLVAALDKPTLSGEPLRQARAVEVLERLGTVGARELLGKLAAGAAGHPLTAQAKAALGRLAR